VRPLPEFQKGHIEGALNIPQDELEARLIHEVPPGMAIEIYCHYCAPCELSEESEGVETYCSTSALWVKKLGFSNVSILKDSLAELSARGVGIVGSPAEAFISGSTPVVR
jgi:rhodanese-related sulfurtransferase